MPPGVAGVMRTSLGTLRQPAFMMARAPRASFERASIGLNVCRSAKLKR
jgi:hypothetical protein